MIVLCSCVCVLWGVFCPEGRKGPGKGMNPALSKSMEFLDNLNTRPFVAGRNKSVHVAYS